ncbi:MAG: Gldg family protein, partial [Bdellovibrionota bacterium]
TLFVIAKALPIALIAICLLFIVALLIPYKNNKNDAHHEDYAPKYFAQSVLSCLVGIAIIICAAVVLNKDNFSKNFDFTTNKVNSLSDESTKFLASLTKQVQIICVPEPNPVDKYCDNSIDLINLYARNSKNILNIGILNLGNKMLLQKIQPSGFSRLVLLSNDNKSELEGPITESKLTNALINLIKFKKVVYFLSGSGEPALTAGNGDRSYADVVNSLQSKAYEVKDWNVKQGQLPSDARVLVVGDNSITYSQEVDSMLVKFVEKGGKILLIINPYHEQGLNKLYSTLNVKLTDKLLTLNTQTPLGQQIAKQNLVRPPVVISNFSTVSPITRVIAQVYGAQAVVPIDGGRPIEILKDSSPNPKTRANVFISAFSAAPITLTEAARNKIDLKKPFALNPDKNFDPNKTWPIAVDVEMNANDVKNKLRKSGIESSQ